MLLLANHEVVDANVNWILWTLVHRGCHFNDFIDKTDDLMKLNVIGLKHFGIEVESVDKKYAELKEKGIDIDDPVDGTTCKKYCFLRDPDGIPIELYESK